VGRPEGRKPRRTSEGAPATEGPLSEAKDLRDPSQPLRASAEGDRKGGPFAGAQGDRKGGPFGLAASG